MHTNKVFTVMICITLVLTWSPVFGQQNQFSMLEGNPEWIFYTNSQSPLLDRTFRGFRFFRYYIRDDEEEKTYPDDGFKYKTLWCEVTDSMGNLTTSGFINLQKYGFVEENPFIMGRVRVDGTKVYAATWMGQMYAICKDDGSTDPLFQYDYSWQPGQTITRIAWNYQKGDYSGAKSSNDVLSRTPVQLADGTTRDLITVYICSPDNKYWRYEPGYNAIEIIDGIGCINGMHHLFWIFSFNQEKTIWDDWNHSYYFYSHLNCFIQNGKVVYIAPRDGLETEEEYEGSARFHTMPFYPDITPESVADGTYTMPATIEMTHRNMSDDVSTYNLQGQRIVNLQKGIIIVDGRKVLMK